MVFMVSSKYFPADYLLNSKEPLTFVFAFSEKKLHVVRDIFILLSYNK